MPPAGTTADPGCSSADDIDESSEGLPPAQDPNPAAVADTPLAGFPRSGSTYAILSSGSTLSADQPNDSPSTTQASGDDPGAAIHGAGIHDAVQLRVNVDVPAGANCLSVDFRFLSEEFPEFVGSSFNDAFVAELDTSDFQATTTGITAPRNFAFDSAGNVISINTTGFTAAEAAGTTYDGSTPLLRASTPITPGAHAVYFTVFDQSDSALDSAALVDALQTSTVSPGGCAAGATSDLTPPDTTITSGPTDPTSNPTPTFAFTSTETPSTFACSVDGGAFTACSSPFTTAALPDGAHTFAVRAIDAVGNVDPTPATRSFTVTTAAPPDTTPPDTTITTGPADPTNDTTPTFTFLSSETPSTFECSVDGAAFTSCASPDTTSALTDGAHTFAVRAIDAAGNVDATPAMRSFTVDTTPPGATITVGPSGVTPDNTPTFEFVSSEVPSTFECSIDAATFTPCTTPNTTEVLADGAHTFAVRAIDTAGNVSPTAATRAFTVAAPPPADTTPPDTTITSGPPATTNISTPTLAFSSSEPASTFECSVDAGAFTACSSPHTTGALADGSHTFAVRAIDAAGNVDATPATRTFTVDTVAPDTTIAPGAPDPTSDSTPTFEFTSSEPGGSFACRIDGGVPFVCTSPFTTPALTDGAHTLSVTATDAANNTDQTPTTRSFTVSTTAAPADPGPAADPGPTTDPGPAADATPPQTLMAPEPDNVVLSDTPRFVFTSSEPGSTFECSIDAGAFTPCRSPLTLSRVAPGTHTFAVRAVDAAGNRDATPSTVRFRVLGFGAGSGTAAQALPAPVVGKTVNVKVISGTVLYRLPGSKTYRKLTDPRQLPIGAILDTRNGRVELTSATGKGGGTQTAQFYDGRFTVIQAQKAGAVTELRLTGNLLCGATSSARAAKKSGAGRKLWGDGKGNFRTKGRNGSATVRGTIWLVQDRCDNSTLFRVRRGVVRVRDTVRKRTITLRASKSYVARPRR